LAAADEDAQTLDLVCARANIKVLKSPGSSTATGSRQTIAVKSIETLISRRGPKLAREILEVIANADRGAITAPQIKVAEMLLTEKDHRIRAMAHCKVVTGALHDLRQQRHSSITAR
jgi:hypothetical protein